MKTAKQVSEQQITVNKKPIFQNKMWDYFLYFYDNCLIIPYRPTLQILRLGFPNLATNVGDLNDGM